MKRTSPLLPPGTIPPHLPLHAPGHYHHHQQPLPMMDIEGGNSSSDDDESVHEHYSGVSFLSPPSEHQYPTSSLPSFSSSSSSSRSLPSSSSSSTSSASSAKSKSSLMSTPSPIFSAAAYSAAHYPSPRNYSASRRSSHRVSARLLVQRWLRSVERNRTLVLRSFLVASLFVLFILLVSYWPYLDMYWIGPQWRRVEAGWRSFRGDAEHLARENAMVARTEFYKRRLLRVPGACDALNAAGRERRAWLTALANDKYLTPTLALSQTLDLFSCVKKKIILVPDDSHSVSETTKDLLRRAGFEVQAKPILDCISAHGSGVSDIALYPGEYMRLYGWNMTEYDRIVYVDSDIMLLDNIDELFDLPLQDDQMGAAYYEEPNIVDTGENSGLLVIKPREQEFKDLLSEWKALFPTVGCVADQPFLWLFYHQPGRSINFLPYSYNVRKRIYHPMRVWHFAGPARLGYKPWIYPHTSTEAYDRPITVFSDVVALWWHFLYGAVRSYGLDHSVWWRKEHERLMSARLQVEERRSFPPLREEIK